jgi:molybdopterin synthase sulfur carrier subunit
VISVNVKLFAAARELTGLNETKLLLDEGATASKVVDHFVETHPPLSSWRNYIRLAVNSEYVDGNHTLQDGDEVAIIPPVSGG